MGPIRGETRPLPVTVEIAPEVQRIDAKLNASIHNRFDIEVIDATTGEVRQRAQAENVICNRLWTRMLSSGSGYFSFIHYGTGSGTPASTDTQLFTFLGYGSPATDDDVTTNDYANGVFSFRRKIKLSESTAVGATLTEVGIGYSSTAASLCTHAMLKDANGNQISIAKTATDIINIYATIFVHFAPEGYDNGHIVVIDGKSKYTNLRNWLLGISYNPMKQACVMTSPMTSQVNYSGASNITITYNVTNKTVTFTASRFAVDAMNLTNGVTEIGLGFSSQDGKATPAIILRVGGAWYPGSTITGEAIGTGDGSIKDFKTAFSFVSDATIYVDGVAQGAGVTVDFGKSLSSTGMVGRYFQYLPAYSGISNDDYSRYYNPTSADGSVMVVYYNPQYAKGIDHFYTNYGIVSVSNDLITWVALSTRSSYQVVNVPTEYQNYKYWKIESGTTYDFHSPNITAYNVHFNTPPASGAVITADYNTPVIAKDTNHVFDLSVTIQLGEHTA